MRVDVEYDGRSWYFKYDIVKLSSTLTIRVIGGGGGCEREMGFFF